MGSDSNAAGRPVVRPLFTVPGWLAGLIQVLPDFGLSALFLITWLSPYTFGETMVKHLVLVMLLEFLVVHSAGFMAGAALSTESPSRRVLVIMGFGVFYSGFTGAFSLAFHSSWPFVSFWILTLNRLLGVIVSPAVDLRQGKVVMSGWALSVLAYLGCCFLTILVPMPRLGITGEVIARQQFSGGGLWIDRPHTAIAFGVFYFLAVGLGELLLVRKLSAGSRADSGL